MFVFSLSIEKTTSTDFVVGARTESQSAEFCSTYVSWGATFNCGTTNSYAFLQVCAAFFLQTLHFFQQAKEVQTAIEPVGTVAIESVVL